jgi:hypothetical protein
MAEAREREHSFREAKLNFSFSLGFGMTALSMYTYGVTCVVDRFRFGD